MTAKSPDHAVQNRAYAELFDALLAPDYNRYVQARPVTVADICARYPDADHDLVLQLQQAAGEAGYPAASNYFRTVRKSKGNASTWNKYRAGYGVIS